MVTELERRGRVTVWLVSLADLDDSTRRGRERFLVAAELARARRFAVQPPRDQFVTARALLRTRLSRYTGVPELEWQFAENDHGRPYVTQPQEYRHIRFNLSHTNELVACAFSTQHDIGVDIENTTRTVDFRDLASSYFAPSEVADIRSRPSEELRTAFFSYWTLKEAYIKGRGMGLALPLDCFWFDLTRKPPVLACNDRCGDDPTQWQFRQMVPTERHLLALGVRAAPGIDLDVDLLWADDGPFARTGSRAVP